ncbi:AraC family transcriptional regulator [Salegentibacter mishustinae]|uniref:AraC family transcriptional regulator n=1 Tax=Salegentibacter mishustinae TaxID=270918 RepID=UPI001CE1232A|nr:AraC family transcriptional regulator [Salegentibacter mishustinae]UBZ08767.1 AraC family transcriptional regulator [Salegentibacter mishustinae]
MKKSSDFIFKKLNFLDQIELFEANQDINYFPFHQHNSFCISLITSGTEIFERKTEKLYIPSHTISITQANEVHKNSSLSELGYSYKTIYVNPEILAYFNDGAKINSIQAVIYDSYLYTQINDLFKKENNNNIYAFERVMKSLCHYKKTYINNGQKRFSIDAFENYIAKDYTKSVGLEHLAKEFYLSKYHFSREFKRQTGISPKAYITLYKIKKAKKDLKLGKKSIVDATYAYGFYDVSHFSNTFKRFYGITPREYLNVFQNSNFIQLNS